MIEMEKLSEFAVTQPQAAHTAFIHVFLHCWSYAARTIPWSPELFHPLDDVVSLHAPLNQTLADQSLQVKSTLFTCSDWSASVWFSGA